MPSNVEIKARVSDIDLVERTASQLSDTPATVLHQEDTFFLVPNGRLKLRQFKDDPEKSELIFYNRPDQAGPKFSEFHTTKVNDPENLKVTLGRALGIKGVVKKTRILYMVGQTRVHIDKVDQLGSFMELEVKMQENQSVEEGQKIAEDLMGKLGIKNSDLITCAYMDLILKDDL